MNVALVVNQLHSNHVVFISRDGHEIAVVYFRCGYGPNGYKSDTVGILWVPEVFSCLGEQN